jgi:5-methylcytosine-specific restriction enzyme subunit McrC
MATLTIFEFDVLVPEGSELSISSAVHRVPVHVFQWLERECARTADSGASSWLRWSQRSGRRVIQVASFVGVVKVPGNFHIEILPKTGRLTSKDEARALLIDMIKCLTGFRHIKTTNAELLAQRMPLLEVFIQQFLSSVTSLVKRGLRSGYVAQQDNLNALRGKLLISKQISQNLVRPDRFFVEYDEFLQDRPENRLLKSALQAVQLISGTYEGQRLTRELSFVFADLSPSMNIEHDIQRIRLDRGMAHYEHPLEWAKLILRGLSPVTGVGIHHAQSLLFPMEAVFEAYVEKHLAKQLSDGFFLKAQASSQHLVSHEKQNWFRLKPDLLVKQGQNTHLVLDTKWKLLDANKNNGREKYQLSQADFYQLYAYGHHYLEGKGDVVLIFPKTDSFTAPLPVFHFPKSDGMRLWVLPFCLSASRLMLPLDDEVIHIFELSN